MFLTSCATNQLYQIHLNLCNKRNIKTKTTKKGTVSLIITGNDSDENECSSSGGLTWCASLEECIYPFVTDCPDCVGSFASLVTGECPVYSDESCGAEQFKCYNSRSRFCYCLDK